jgi:hypothetical protein
VPIFAWRRRAVDGLQGVGDASNGEWEEFTGRAYHIRRRLSAEEEAVIGPAVDLRGTPEAVSRFEAVKPFVNAMHEAMANREIKDASSLKEGAR